MKVWLILAFLIIYWEESTSSKIPISRCQTAAHGFEGSCRIPNECVAVDRFEASNCPHGLICCPRGRFSQRMCYQYSELVFGTDEAVNLMAHGQPSQDVDQCGIIAVPLIVGGEKVQPKEFPHQAALGFGDDPWDPDTKWECGGSLISEIFVLTAAHCVLPNKKPRWVRVGIINLYNDVNNQQTYEIAEYILHPGYSYHTKLNDIALLRLSRPVDFTAYVRPACLDYNGIIEEHRAIATGFGLTEYGGAQSQDLLKVQLEILDKGPCRHLVKTHSPEGLHNTQICAGVLSGGKDTCQGDSGGPLQTIKQSPYCMYNIIGVTSFGAQCGMEYSPAIYTRVWSYVPWIEAHIWPNEI